MHTRSHALRSRGTPERCIASSSKLPAMVPSDGEIGSAADSAKQFATWEALGSRSWLSLLSLDASPGYSLQQIISAQHYGIAASTSRADILVNILMYRSWRHELMVRRQSGCKPVRHHEIGTGKWLLRRFLSGVSRLVCLWRQVEGVDLILGDVAVEPLNPGMQQLFAG